MQSILASRVLEVKRLEHLMTALHWNKSPILDEFPHLHEFQHLTDLNARRLRDAEVLAAACQNEGSQNVLEIGTSTGQTTALMSRNAPEATIHTVNIPPEQIADGGKLVTYAPSHQQIGHVYRQMGCTNVHQILANTAIWEPDMEIDVAFIDGCHDADFVFNDTIKVLRHCHPGSIVMWHDFAPPLISACEWIEQVCCGVAKLYKYNQITAPILHLEDSWIGLYRVGGYENITRSR